MVPLSSIQLGWFRNRWGAAADGMLSECILVIWALVSVLWERISMLSKLIWGLWAARRLGALGLITTLGRA